MRNYRIVFVILFSLFLFNSNGQTLFPISIDNSGNYNFDSLKTFFESKRVVCLGEVNHGEETFSRFKNSLVKYLHKNLGFEVLAFESNLLNISNAYYNFKSDTLALKESLFGVWQTESMLDLYKYISASKNTKNPLLTSGFDIQPSISFDAAAWLRKIIYPVNREFSNLIYSTDTAFINKINFIRRNIAKAQRATTISNHESKQLQQFYQSLLDTFSFHKNLIMSANSFNETQYKIIKQCLVNRIDASEFYSIRNIVKNMNYRDLKMTENINWLMTELYPDKKIIIWAADAHISKVTTTGYAKDGLKSSVEMLPVTLKEQVLCISLNYLKNMPVEERKEISDIFFVKYPAYLNGEFEGVFYFKETEKIEKYKIKY